MVTGTSVGKKNLESDNLSSDPASYDIFEEVASHLNTFIQLVTGHICFAWVRHTPQQF